MIHKETGSCLIKKSLLPLRDERLMTSSTSITLKNGSGRIVSIQLQKLLYVRLGTEVESVRSRSSIGTTILFCFGIVQKTFQLIQPRKGFVELDKAVTVSIELNPSSGPQEAPLLPEVQNSHHHNIVQIRKFKL